MEKETEKTAEEILGLGRKSLAIRVDVRNSQDVQRMVDQTRATFSRIDVLFNNAGVIEIHNFLEIREEEWDKVMDVNAKGVFMCAQSVARVMKEQKAGVIVNTSSVASRRGMSQAAVYGASKSVVSSLTWSMASALAPFGIRVNAIAPGMIDTDLWQYVDKKSAEISGIPQGEPRKRRIQGIPLNRPGTVDEVAKVAIFLASNEASYVHGQILNVNGGDFMS